MRREIGLNAVIVLKRALKIPKESAQSRMFSPIIATSQPITLVGAASLEPADLNISLKYAPTLVAADGGADHVLAAGLVPEAVIGDLDSLSDDAKFAFRDVLHPVAEQDTTDFEKALARIDAPLILALGFMGGRLDHTLAALNAVVRHACPVLVIGSDDVAFVAPKAMQLALPAGTRVGLLPFG